MFLYFDFCSRFSPEGALIIEDVIEKIAANLSIDPALVREKNLTRQGDFPHHGSRYDADLSLVNAMNTII